jgi:hypothetical protein
MASWPHIPQQNEGDNSTTWPRGLPFGIDEWPFGWSTAQMALVLAACSTALLLVLALLVCCRVCCPPRSPRRRELSCGRKESYSVLADDEQPAHELARGAGGVQEEVDLPLPLPQKEQEEEEEVSPIIPIPDEYPGVEDITADGFGGGELYTGSGGQGSGGVGTTAEEVSRLSMWSAGTGGGGGEYGGGDDGASEVAAASLQRLGELERQLQEARLAAEGWRLRAHTARHGSGTASPAARPPLSASSSAGPAQEDGLDAHQAAAAGGMRSHRSRLVGEGGRAQPLQARLSRSTLELIDAEIEVDRWRQEAEAAEAEAAAAAAAAAQRN